MTLIAHLNAASGKRTTVDVKGQQQIRLAPGDLVTLPEGAQALRQGADLVVVLPPDVPGAKPAQVVLVGFFAAGALGLVQIGTDGAAKMLSARSEVSTDPATIKPFAEPDSADTADHGSVVQAQVFADLPSQETNPQALFNTAPATQAPTGPASWQSRAAMGLTNLALDASSIVVPDMSNSANSRFSATMPVIARAAYLNKAALANGTFEVHGTGQAGLTVDVVLGGVLTRSLIVSADNTWRVNLTAAEINTLAGLGEGQVQILATHSLPGGQVVSETAQSYLVVDLTAPAAPVIVTPPAELADNLLTRSETGGNLRWAGTAEPNSQLSFTAKDSLGKTLNFTVAVGTNGRWTLEVPGSQWRTLTDGSISFEAKATDQAGNAGATSSTSFVLNKEPPPPPTNLRLFASDDTGSSASDGITSVAQPRLTGNAQAGLTVVAFMDSNGNGALDAGEELGRAVADAAGQFTLTPSTALSNGAHTLTFKTIDATGNTQDRGATLTVTVDTVATPVTLDVVSTNDKISYAELKAGPVVLTGTAGAYDVVTVVVSQGSYSAAFKATAGADGKWVVNVAAASLMNNITTGTATTFTVSAEDLAGNRSPSVSRDINIRTTPVPGVTALQLAAGQDSGDSATDNLTNIAAPALTGKVGGLNTAGLRVRLYDDVNGNGLVDAQDVYLGEGLVDAKGNFAATSAKALLDGRHALIAQTDDPNSGDTSGGDVLSLVVTVDTVAAPVSFDPVTADDRVLQGELATGAVVLSGKGEVGARVLLRLSGGSDDDILLNDVIVDKNGHWESQLTADIAQALGNGSIALIAKQTDLAGNTGAESTKIFTLSTGALDAPGVLLLQRNQDTGASNSDGITQTTTGLVLRATATAGQTLYVFEDLNNNNVMDAGELLGSSVVADTGVGSVTVNLAEGTHQLRAYVKELDTGKTSDPSVATRLVIDTTVLAPSEVMATANNAISAAEVLANTDIISGKGEPGGTVKLNFYNAGSSTVLATRSASISTAGTWTYNLSADDLQLMGQGRFDILANQTDLAGNVSTSTSLSMLIDTIAPGLPSAASLEAALEVNQSGVLADGLIWTEAYADSDHDGKVDSQTIDVAVAVDPAQVQVGDSVALRWGNQTITASITADDLSRGYILVGLSGDAAAAAAVAAGKDSSQLSVQAQFVDQAGNTSPLFDVLTNYDGSLKGSVTTLTVQGASTIQGTTYSNQVNQTVKLSGEPGAVVSLFVDRNGDGQLNAGEIVGQPVTLDSNGQGSITMSLAQQAGAYTLRTSTSFTGLPTVVSPATLLVVDTSAPSTPIIKNAGALADGFVSAAERNAGVALSGTAEPLAALQVQLLNTTTGVYGDSFTVQVNAAGEWQFPLTIFQLGQVGDGPIRLSITAYDIAGNTSARLDRDFVFDTIAKPPTIFDVQGDNQINAAELNPTASQDNITFSGGGEPGATITLTLSGAKGAYGPLTPVVDTQGRWSVDIDESIIMDKLGDGSVTITASQRDVAGNVSTQATKTILIDTVVAAPVLEVVAGDNFINASEKANGVLLRGTAEPGATVALTLTLGDHTLPITVVANKDGAWATTLSPQQLTDLGEGSLTISAVQTDLAGNVSAATTRAVIVLTTELTPAVTLNSVTADNQLSLAEQANPVTLTGSGPANAVLSLQMRGSKGNVTLSPTIGSDGGWSMALSTTDMQTLGAGTVTASYYATAGQQSTAVAAGSFTIELAILSPTWQKVGTDGIVNAEEASATAGVLLQGAGIAGYTVEVTLIGANGARLPPRQALVGTDKVWQLTLTPADIASLGEGTVRVALSQSEPIANGIKTSITVNPSFMIDTLPPALPTEANVTAAQSYNLSTKGELGNGVTIAEAQDGVTLAVPLSTTGLVAGDKVLVHWGSEVFTHAITADEAGTAQIIVTVPSALVAKQGSGTLDIAISFQDIAGNTSQAVVLASQVAVSTPPAAPVISPISDDGYVNKVEYEASGSTPLLLAGTAGLTGSVNLVLTNTAEHTSVDLGRVTVTDGIWQASVTQAQLDTLKEGNITVSAVYTNAANVSSPAGVSTLVFDKTPPLAPTQVHLDLAIDENAKSELAGGLTRLNGEVTEAANGTEVRVALAADAASGDKLSLYWGGLTNEVNVQVTQTDINRGYALVNVSADMITRVGDSTNLQVQARATDRAGNVGSMYNVWNGYVDALPQAPGLDTPTFGDWLNLSEANASWRLSGTGNAGNKVVLTLTGAAGSVQRTVLVDANGNWQSGTLTQADAVTLLGTNRPAGGSVSVSAVQYDLDKKGQLANPSAPTISNFLVDLTPPDAPGINEVHANRIGLAQAQNGVTFSGTAEAKNNIEFTLTNANNKVVTLTTRVLDNGSWSVLAVESDFAALGRGPLTLGATQRDAAGNTSTKSSRSISYSDEYVAKPAVNSVSGISPGSDLTFNLADQEAASGLVVQGTGLVDNEVKVQISVNGVSQTFDVGPLTTTSWTLRLTAEQTAALGQGTARVSAVQIKPVTLDESALADFNGGASFLIDTNRPELRKATVLANGMDGNAKAGDVVTVELQTSEPVTMTSVTAGNLPQLQLLLSNGLTQNATFNAAESSGGRLVFNYTVQAGDNAAHLTLGNLMLNGARIVDNAGNAALVNVLPDVSSHTVVVDTTPPGMPSLRSIDKALAGTAGGTAINLAEAEAGVTVTVGLQSTDAKVGHAVQVFWNGATTTQVLTAADISANQVSVTLAALTVTSGGQRSVSVQVGLRDEAGNLSTPSAAQTVQVDTVPPDPLTVNAWTGNNRISATEVDAITDLTGTNAEANASVSVTLSQGASSRTFSTQANASGIWRISAADLQPFVSSLADGTITVRAQTTDAAGNVSVDTTVPVFLDRIPPEVPGTPVIAAAKDGWINEAEARTGVRVQVSLAGTKASAGDRLHITGLSEDYSVILTAGAIAVNQATLTLPSRLLLQADTEIAPRTVNMGAWLEDRGGNTSSTSAATSLQVDTLISNPLVSKAAGTVAFGVGPAQLKTGMTVPFEGTADTGDTVAVQLTGQGGETIRVSGTVEAGQFKFDLGASDLRLLGDGLASYGVSATDKAGNVSEVMTGSFDIQTGLAAPALNDIAGDNIIGVSEASISQLVSGIGTAGAKVKVEFLTQDAAGKYTRLFATKTVATVPANRLWNVALTPDEITALSPLNLGSVQVRVTQQMMINGENAVSNPSTLLLAINRQAPALAAAPVSLFDADGNGANNDGLLVSFTEAVRVLDLSNLTTAFSTSKSWGNGARIEAVTPTTVNGVQFAQSYQIYLGTSATLTAGDLVGVLQANVVNMGGNISAQAQNFSVPDLSNIYRPVAQININQNTLTSSNYISSVEKSAVTSISFTFAASTGTYDPSAPALSAVAGDTLEVYRDGTLVKSVTLAASTSQVVTLTGSDWGSDGQHTLWARVVSNSGTTKGLTSQYSAPKLVMVDTVAPSSDTARLTNWTDVDGNGVMSAGDKILVDFDEVVTLTKAGGLGTGAIVRPRGAMNLLPVLNSELNDQITVKGMPNYTPWLLSVNSTGTAPVIAGGVASFANADANVGGTISQSVNTVIGETYTVSWVQTGASVQFQAFVSGAPIASQSFGAGNNSFSFVATATTTNLRFRDNVSAIGTATTLDDIKLIGGVSTGWEVTLGSNAAISGGTLTLSGVKDFAGNSGTVSLAPLALPGQPVIGNVTADNVINSSERHTAQTVRISVANLADGDTVKLFMDGVDMTGQASQAARVGGANGYVDFTLPPTAWGADGERVLTTSVTRGATTVQSTARHVYVAADADHWSVGTLWFDPETVSNAQLDGTPVTTWTASTVPGFSLTLATLDSGISKPLTVRLPSGRTGIYFNGYQTLGNWDLAELQKIAPYLQDTVNTSGPTQGSFTTLSVGLRDAARASFATNNFFLGFSTSDERNHAWGLGFNGVNSRFTHNMNGLEVPNAAADSVWTLSTYQSVGGLSDVTGYGTWFNGQKVQGYAKNPNNSPNPMVMPILDMTQLAKFSLGGDGGGVGSAFNQNMVGLVGDVVITRDVMQSAWRQEVESYLAVKYSLLGTPVSAIAGQALYDLSGSTNSANTVDGLLDLSGAVGAGAQTIVTAGSDYINAGAGNDRVEVKDLAFRSIDGGLGSDTLAISAAYTGASTMVLADFVSNSRGLGSDEAANARVNAAGFHKLAGFEKIDLVQKGGRDNLRQTLTVAATDVDQLSETNTLELMLGNTDVLIGTGFTSTQKGVFSYNGSWYDTRYSGVVNQQAVTMYSQGGDAAPSIKSIEGVGTTALKLNFDETMSSGQALAGHFAISALNGSTLPSLDSVSLVNLRQGLLMTFKGNMETSIKVQYSGDLLGESGQGFAYNNWLIGTSGDDSATSGTGLRALNATSLTLAEQDAGVMLVGGAGRDALVGGRGADLLIGGMGADTLTGGAGSDTFKFVNERDGVGAAAGLGGLTGDVIADFNFGTSGETQADKLDLSQLFDAAALGATGKASTDAAKLINGGFLDLVSVYNRTTGGDDMQIWVDRDGGGVTGKLVTLTDGYTNLPGGFPTAEATQQLIERLLTEGRLIVSS